MFKTPIILVDDNQEYLDQLNRAFALSGLSCVPIFFDRNNPDNVSGIDHITFDTKHARIIALDINLREYPSTQDAKVLFPTIEMVLKRLNPRGPYYLIFWSKYKDLPEEMIDLLATRSKDEVVAPVGWGFIDKINFKPSDPPDELKNTLLELVRRVCIFRLLLGWENRTSYAASDTLSELYKIAAAQNDNGWKIDKTSARLVTLLTHIAHESVGHMNSKDAANHAIETGLLPIMEDNLIGMTGEDDVVRLNDEWTTCLNKLGDRKGLDNLCPEDIASLNSFYNLEEHPPYPKCKRGVFVTLSSRVLRSNCLFNYVFGKEATYKKLVCEEFLFNNEVENKQFREEARNSIELGWLEIGAVCDHAQRKNRLHRFLLSALVPSKYLSMVSKGKQETAHDGIYRSPLLQYKSAQYILLISFRYTVGLHKNSKVLDKPLFRIKEQMINEIAFAWSRHSIRPGITSFLSHD